MKQLSPKDLVYLSIYYIICIACCLSVYLNSFSVFRSKTASPDITDYHELVSGIPISQKVNSHNGALKNIYIRFGTFGRVNNALLNVQLLDNSALIAEWNIDTSELLDVSYKKLTLPHHFQMSNNGNYTLQITETFEGNNSVAVYLSQGGNDLTTGFDKAIIGNRTLCYQLESVDLKNTHLLQLLIILIMLSIIVYLASCKDIHFIKKILVVLSVTIILNVMMVDLFEKINSEVRIVSFNNNTQTTELQPGKKVTFGLSNHQCSFDVLEVFVESEYVDEAHVVLRNIASGEVLQDINVNETNLIADSITGKKAVLLFPDHRIEKGEYEVLIDNQGSHPITLFTSDAKLNVVEIRHTKLGVYIALLIVALLFVYISLVSILIKKGLLTIECFFLITVIIFGICNFVLFTPWNVNDTGAHYLATYRLSNMILGYPKEQHWYGRVEDRDFYDNLWFKDFNPSMLGYIDLVDDAHLLCTDSTMTDLTVHEPKMEYYSFFSYWPQTLGIAIGRIFGLSTIACIYLARLMIFIFYMWGCYNAIKNAPVGKCLFAFISLFPMTLMYSSAISYDPLVLISTLNFVSGTLALYKNPSSKKMLVQVLIWTFLVGATKGGGYLVLLPLVLILFERADKKKTCIICLSIITSGLLSVLVFDKLLQLNSNLFQLGVEGNGYMAAGYALQHPLDYLRMCAITYFDNANSYIFDLIGSNLGWCEFVIPDYVLTGMIIITLLYAIVEEDELHLSNRHKHIFIFVVALILLTTPAMLLSWTRKGSETIAGIQGRYYLPALVIVFLLLTKFPINDLKLYNKTDSNAVGMVKNRCLCIFGLLLCLSFYYMLRLYLRR